MTVKIYHLAKTELLKFGFRLWLLIDNCNGKSERFDGGGTFYLSPMDCETVWPDEWIPRFP
jgi:hypothetical protein